jgi:acetoin utilization deacetylase AcuC-like enzyme
MTDATVSAADRHCDGRLVVCHEGGYSSQIAPWCILNVIESLAGKPERPLDGMSLWVAAGGGHELKVTEEAVIEEAATFVAEVPTTR